MRLLRPLWPPLGVYIGSVLLVMSNDLHQMVFRFDPGGNWMHDYRYGLGFWLIIGVSNVYIRFAHARLRKSLT